jgi:hypothetical protein
MEKIRRNSLYWSIVAFGMSLVVLLLMWATGHNGPLAISGHIVPLGLILPNYSSSPPVLPQISSAWILLIIPLIFFAIVHTKGVIEEFAENETDFDLFRYLRVGLFVGIGLFGSTYFLNNEVLIPIIVVLSLVYPGIVCYFRFDETKGYLNLENSATKFFRALFFYASSLGVFIFLCLFFHSGETFFVSMLGGFWFIFLSLLFSLAIKTIIGFIIALVENTLFLAGYILIELHANKELPGSD